VAKVTAEQFLTLMSKQIGYVERPINKTKYSRKFGVRVAQWCGYLHNWVAVKCGWKLGVHVPNTAYTPNGVAWFTREGKYETKGNIPVGAWLYFDFPGDDVNRVSHVGTCVFDFGDGEVLTIEGNTTGPKGLRVDQRNGGECAVKIRSKKLIVGWGLPPYADAPHPIVEKLVEQFAPHKVKYDVEFEPAEGL
jgi:hypothetical protein